MLIEFNTSHTTIMTQQYQVLAIGLNAAKYISLEKYTNSILNKSVIIFPCKYTLNCYTIFPYVDTKTLFKERAL